MHRMSLMGRAVVNGAVAGAAAAACLAVILALTALFSGGSHALPGLIDAAGGTTNGAASVEFTLGWVVLAAAAAAGAAIEAARVHRQVQHGS
jgi:hypothetical protein